MNSHIRRINNNDVVSVCFELSGGVCVDFKNCFACFTASVDMKQMLPVKLSPRDSEGNLKARRPVSPHHQPLQPQPSHSGNQTAPPDIPRQASTALDPLCKQSLGPTDKAVVCLLAPQIPSAPRMATWTPSPASPFSQPKTRTSSRPSSTLWATRPPRKTLSFSEHRPRHAGKFQWKKHTSLTLWRNSLNFYVETF